MNYADTASCTFLERAATPGGGYLESVIPNSMSVLTTSRPEERGFPEGEFKIARFLGGTLSRSPVMGCRPVISKGVRFSAFSPVNRAFRPGRAGRFDGAEYRSVPPRQGIQPARYRHSCPVCGPGRGGLVRSDLVPREKSWRSRGAVKDRVSHRGNSSTDVSGGLWHSVHRFIPALKRGAFSCGPPKTGQDRPEDVTQSKR